MAGVAEEEISVGDKCETLLTDSNREPARTVQGVLCGIMPAITYRQDTRQQFNKIKSFVCGLSFKESFTLQVEFQRCSATSTVFTESNAYRWKLSGDLWRYTMTDYMNFLSL